MNESNNPSKIVTRRQMLATSAAALAGAALAAPERAAAADNPDQKDHGDMRPHVSFSLAGKGASVTGAARGIGRAICVALAAAGADVLGFDIAGSVSSSLVYPAGLAK